MVLFVVSFGLFVEEILYGVIAPLTPESPAQIRDEHFISILYGAYALGLILSTPVLAIVTDRLGRRRPMLFGVFFLLIATVLFAIGTTKEMHLIARVFEGMGAACTWTAGLALVAKYYVKDRVKGMGYAMLGATTGSIVGPVVGGEMFAAGGYTAPFYFVAAGLAVDASLRWLFVPSSKKRSNMKPWKDWFAELGGIVTDKSVLAAAFAVALAAAGWSLMEPLFPMHVIKIGHASPALIGALFTASNFLYAFCTPVVSIVSERIGVRPTTVLGLFSTAVCLPLLAFSTSIPLATAVLCLITIGYAFTVNPTSAELGDAVDRRGSNSYSVAYAVYNLAYSLGMIGVDGYLQYVTDSAHKLDLFHILAIVSVLFLLCTPFFMFKPKIHGVFHEEDDEHDIYPPPTPEVQPEAKPKKSPTFDLNRTIAPPNKPFPELKARHTISDDDDGLERPKISESAKQEASDGGQPGEPKETQPTQTPEVNPSN